MFSIFTHDMLRDTHSKPGLPVIWHLLFTPKSTELTVAEKGIFFLYFREEPWFPETTRIVSSVSWDGDKGCCWSQTVESTKLLMVELTRCLGYFQGRPPTYYYRLLQKEKELESIIRRLLPKAIADTVRHTGYRLAHLYGLPKTHKDRLAMRPILPATQTDMQLRFGKMARR